MKIHQTRNRVLALVALAGLSVYILACTSFSPDDSKVLFPAFDSGSGAIGMAVYDRETRRSEMLFVPVAYAQGQTNTMAPAFMRGQWMDRGRQILLAYALAKDDDNSEINLLVLPSSGKGPTKLLRLPNLKDVASSLVMPLCVVNNRVFLQTAPHEIVRVDLHTGIQARHEFADAVNEVNLFPSPDGTRLFYFESLENPDKGVSFGTVNPEDFSRTLLMRMTNGIPNGALPACDSQGKVLALLQAGGATNQLAVWREGKPVFTRAFGSPGVEWSFGSAAISSKGDKLWATFQKKTPGTNAVSYGLVEVPFSDAAIRETVLLSAIRRTGDADAVYFQGSVSHDGKTAAVASTLLALGEKNFSASDCALFLVDLASPDRKVTKVPIPLPPAGSMPVSK
jgi:hypothetical protein